MDFLLILFILIIVTGYFRLYSIFSNNQKLNKDQFALKQIIEISKSIFPILLTVFFIRSFLFEPFRIPSGSMKPTLLEGDFIIVKKYSYDLNLPFLKTSILNINDPRSGDIIVFKHKRNINMVKRIVGIPEDKIFYKNKFIYINEKIQKQFDMGGTTDKNKNDLLLHVRKKKELIKNIRHDIYHIVGLKNRKYEFNNIKIKKNKYFVMGDFRDNSQDSRVWGLVDRKDIIGKVEIIWMSWDYTNKDVRWNRLGKKIQ